MPPPANKYVVMLDGHADERTIAATQQALDKPLMNSKDLGDNMRAKQVYEQGMGVYFKYLDLAVVENVDPARLEAAMRSDSPIMHYELEQRFRPVSPLDELRGIRQTIDQLQRQIDSLEAAIEAGATPPPAPEPEPVSDPSRLTTWGLGAMGLRATSLTGQGVKVAVLDTGIFRNHPDFSHLTIEGKSFVNDESWDRDGNGHGTHCAGIICANKSDQNGRHYSVAPEVQLYVGQVLDRAGDGLTSGVLDGIDWALSQDCRLISLSLGAPVRLGASPNPLFERVGRRALERNCLIVAAAGNESRRRDRDPEPVNSPANAESIMAVAALDRRLRVANFSNAGLNDPGGGRIDLAAPGVEVYSSFSQLAQGGSLYRSLNGTSMAVPHVAGLAALYMQQFPDLSAEGIWLKLERNAKSIPGQHAVDVGSGLAHAVIEQEI